MICHITRLAMFDELYTWLEQKHTTLPTILNTLLTDSRLHNHPLSDQLRSGASDIWTALLNIDDHRQHAEIWARQTTTHMYLKEIRLLTNKDNGWHFSAVHASTDQIEGFHLNEMVACMQELAPSLWELLDNLFRVTTTQLYKRKRIIEDTQTYTVIPPITDAEEIYWNEIDGSLEANVSRPEEGARETMAQRYKALLSVVSP